MDSFESIALSGLRKDQYSILWVRHTHAGHHELSFVVLVLNTRPVSRSISRSRQGNSRIIRYVSQPLERRVRPWPDPDDPARSQAVSCPTTSPSCWQRPGEMGASCSPRPTALRHKIIEAVTLYVRQEVALRGEDP